MTQRLDKGKIIYLEDRSGAELDDKCGMAYWWNRLQGGKGIVPVAAAEELEIGAETHEDLRVIAEAEDIGEGSIKEAIAELVKELPSDAKVEQRKMELFYRRLGWIAAFAIYIEPILREKYETIQVESELVLDREPLWVPVTPDRVLKDKKTGLLVYREYKTTISANNKWQQSWHYAIQLHLGMAAIQEETGKRVQFGQIMGLMKGYYSATDRKLRHPYVWAYYNISSNEWTHDYEKARGAQWISMPVWEYPGGLVEWVKLCGKDVAISQFPHSAPVFYHEGMVNEWVERRLARQTQIRRVRKQCETDSKMRGVFFEKRTSRCRPAIGPQCPYLMACWNAMTNRDPLAEGVYKERDPHHEIELTMED